MDINKNVIGRVWSWIHKVPLIRSTPGLEDGPPNFVNMPFIFILYGFCELV